MFKKIISGALTLVFSFTAYGWAQQAPLMDKVSKDKVPVTITAQQAEFNNKQNKAIYRGNVKVVRENATMYSDELEAFFEQGGKELDHIVATGNVRLLQENRVITSQKGVFYNADQKIVLTGSPVSKEGDNVIEGVRMTYFLNQERVIVEDAKSILSPDKNKNSENKAPESKTAEKSEKKSAEK